MTPEFFRHDIDEEEFKQHARDNYTVGTPIDAEGIRHPVWVLEAARMNYEVWDAYAHARRTANE